MDINGIRNLLDCWGRAQPNDRIELNFNQLNDIADVLVENTGKDMVNDPFTNNNNTLFREFSLTLGSGMAEKQLGIYFFKKFYEKCIELEINHGKRIHKGDTLNWIGRYYFELKQYHESFYYWILDYLEDILSEYYKTSSNQGELCISDAKRAPVCEMLQLYFGVPAINLKELYNNSIEVLKNENELILHPEILQFRLRNKGIQTPRLIDYRYYHPNLSYLKSTYNNILNYDDFKLWEKFAAYLLSSIDGFEPITNLSTGEGTYEFDVIIRNNTNIELFTSKFGDYIGVECKYYKEKTITVEQLNHFASKLKYHDIRCGVIFTKTSISGWTDIEGQKYGKLVQTKIYNRNNIIIFDINNEDVNRILDGKNLVELLIEKYETVRLGL
ncbi:hypothetical protein JW865_06615 [Candidatus Bathyarchaeota archaeon]|nr:hypothetical protein [Candidatus Bathyarchaeota archaeon]